MRFWPMCSKTGRQYCNEDRPQVCITSMWPAMALFMAGLLRCDACGAGGDSDSTAFYKGGYYLPVLMGIRDEAVSMAAPLFGVMSDSSFRAGPRKCFG